MTQERPSNMEIISIKRELALNINYDNIIDEFTTEKKARKVAI